ncbi:MAG: LacI family DNA-binding transcriptional regulator [Planctomycetota bacterium]
MARRAVFTDVMNVIERRITAGEFMLKDIPGERKLADEVGVSYMTARKAVTKLIEKSVLTRRANGTLEVHPNFLNSADTCQVAMLAPAFATTHLARCRLGVTTAADNDDRVRLRSLEYLHWDDAVVREAVENSDGCIIIPSTEKIPDRVMKVFKAQSTKVVFLDANLTDQGLVSVRLVAEEYIAEIFEHLRSLGHRRIDCLNTQGRVDEIESRIDQWRRFIGAHGLQGTLFDDPAPPYTDPTSRAHRKMHEVLEQHRGQLSALVCTTSPAALAAMRACHDLGVKVGSEVSICTINNEPTGKYFFPSLTGLEMPDIGPMLERCFEWFAAAPDAPWTHDLLITPAESTLLKGESTGPAPHPRRRFQSLNRR